MNTVATTEPASQNEAVTFSVIIPTYNAEATIVRTVRSVIVQSFAACEIIVADDASTDNSIGLIEAEFGNRIKIIRNKQNRGSSAVRNQAMDIATGRYIAFVDADDYWHKDKLRIVNNVVATHTGIALLYHPYTMNDIAAKDYSLQPHVKTLPFAAMLLNNRIATSCAIIRNDAAFRFKPDMRYTEDYDLWLRIGYRHKIHYIGHPLTQIFRPFTSPGGISGNKWKMRKGEMRAQIRLVKLNPLFLLLLPFLLMLSLAKHVYKAVL